MGLSRHMRRQHHVLILHRRGLARDGLCALIGREAAFVVAGAVEDAAALDTLHVEAEPEVILVDPTAVGWDPERIIRAAHGRWPNVRVLVLTAASEREAVDAALRAGVDGYLLDSDGREELLDALQAVCQRRRYLSPTLSNPSHAPSPGLGTRTTPDESDGLSDREREVMKLVARGLRTREIAGKLSVSYKTVEKHRTNLMRKLGIRSAAGVAAYAISRGYLLP